MSFGPTLANVTKVNRPGATDLPWGTVTSCTEMPQYALYRYQLKPNGCQQLHFNLLGETRIFVEAGDAVLRTLDGEGNESRSVARQGRVVSVEPHQPHAFSTGDGATLYMFARRNGVPLSFHNVESRDRAMQALFNVDVASLPEAGSETSDVREKYWGRIETIRSDSVAGKRIFVRKDGQSSLEYHVEKRETYFIHSGLLRLGLRIGRAENHSLLLGAGQSYDVHPGVMHMRMAVEDTVIIEASTEDSDADSYLVEDGQTYRHVDHRT
jgi:mannose-6-phosphate isomerase-like protein (cupin superfamily)